MKIEPPRKRYAIYFTPRSGSTWLTDLCTQTRRLGEPNEFFNPQMVTNTAQFRNVTSIAEYIDIIMRRRSVNGIFGFEVTVAQLRTTFPSEALFVDYFRDDYAFWLTRRDIVMQAVSIVKKKQTKIGHISSDEEPDEADEASFSYDGPAIHRAVRGLTALERRSEAFFLRHGINPIRLVYEDLIALPPIEVANRLARGIDEPEFETFEFISKLKRTGTTKNDEIAERFRDEFGSFVQFTEARRQQSTVPLRRPPRQASFVRRLFG